MTKNNLSAEDTRKYFLDEKGMQILWDKIMKTMDLELKKIMKKVEDELKNIDRYEPSNISASVDNTNLTISYKNDSVIVNGTDLTFVGKNDNIKVENDNLIINTK
jgi:superoxide dismutase